MKPRSPGPQLHASKLGRAQFIAVKNCGANCAPAPPTLARSDDTTVHSAPVEAPHTGDISKQDTKHAATISRKRGIEASKRATRRILTAFPAVNKESSLTAKYLLPPNLPPPLAVARFRCYNACQHMADWKQITARIRRARTGKDPVGQLSNLYEKTRDAMVAFELARYFETAGQNPEAAKWYLAAAERFRRADWKVKAQEAAVRLGAEVSAVDPVHASGDFMLTPLSIGDPEPLPPMEENPPRPKLRRLLPESETESEDASVKPEGESADSPEKKRRRRGRRGGRNRRKGEPSKSPSKPSPHPRTRNRRLQRKVCLREYSTNRPSQDLREPWRAAPFLISPSSRIGEPGGPSVRGRSGDPASPPDCRFSKCISPLVDLSSRET